MQVVDAVIPTYQETERLFRAVASAKAQTHQINKIFVIDDGSSDDIRNEISKKLLGDPQIEVIHNPHTGLPGVGRRLGIERSQADWIAFLDADDAWMKNKTSRQLSVAGQCGADLVFSNAEVLREGYRRAPFFSEKRFQADPSFKQLVADNRIVNSSVLVRRASLLSIGVYPSSSNVRGVEDYATWLRMRVNFSMTGLNEELVEYEVSQNSLSASSDPMVRIFALADFVVWSRGAEAGHTRKHRSARKEALKQILRENK